MNSLRRLVLAALALVAAPALAAEEFILLQTQESTDIAAPCPNQNIKLGAYVYAPRTRAVDGHVVRDLGRPVGTVVGCGQLPWPVTLDSVAPFNMDFDLGGRRIVAAGSCKVADIFPAATNPNAMVVLVGCTLKVGEDKSQALVTGVATSASVFMLGKAPGYETGSYWTLHLYTKD